MAVQAFVLTEVLDRQVKPVFGYEGMPIEAASNELLVPLFRSHQRVFNAGDRADTSLYIVNPGEVEARVIIRYFGSNDPQASYTWWPPLINAIVPGTFGSALVISDQPTIALVVDYPMFGQVDPAAYLGITTRSFSFRLCSLCFYGGCRSGRIPRGFRGCTSLGRYASSSSLSGRK